MMAAPVLLAAWLAAGPADFSGNWHLNVQKSSWGKRARPVAVEISIEHRDPAFRYSGTVAQDTEGKTVPFSYEGAIDGKPHPVQGGNTGGGTISYKRLSARALESEARSADGGIVERAVTSLSADGKTMTRRVRLKAPGGASAWTEVYDKK